MQHLEVKQVQISKAKLNLAQARAELSYGELQEKSGISNGTLARILRGVQQPRPATVGKLARALGVDPVELMEEQQ
jgi:transcriptional regulator with XRE-family HTH domain